MKQKNIYALALISVVFAACESSTSTSGVTTTGTTYVQVERLARPAINEGLVITNSNLNLWNSVPPSDDLATAGAGIVAEAGGTLTAVHNYAAAVPQSLAPPPVSQIVSGFLPDVMRIDTTKTIHGNPGTLTNVTDGTMAYDGCLGPTHFILCGGRKLRDNVVQITINYLANGTNDSFAGVTYDPTTQGPPTLLSGFPYEALPY